MAKIKLVDAAQMKSDIPPFVPGDTLNVHMRVIEGDLYRSENPPSLIIAHRYCAVVFAFSPDVQHLQKIILQDPSSEGQEVEPVVL